MPWPATALQRVLSLTLLGALALTATASTAAVDESELKAAIVFNLLLFVEWPPESAPQPGNPMVLCTGPDARLRPALKALQGRVVRNVRLDVRDIELGAVPATCHAVFIEAQDGPHAANLAAPPAKPGGTPAASLLVISDDTELPAASASVVLRRLGNRLAFDVNLQAARQARLQVSAKLLRLAREVRE